MFSIIRNRQILTFSINNNNFGLITGAAAKSTQHRQFQAQLRLNF